MDERDDGPVAEVRGTTSTLFKEGDGATANPMTDAAHSRREEENKAAEAEVEVEVEVEVGDAAPRKPAPRLTEAEVEVTVERLRSRSRSWTVEAGNERSSRTSGVIGRADVRTAEEQEDYARRKSTCVGWTVVVVVGGFGTTTVDGCHGPGPSRARPAASTGAIVAVIPSHRSRVLANPPPPQPNPPQPHPFPYAPPQVRHDRTREPAGRHSYPRGFRAG